jgi:DNA polymerase III delta prime subunit/DNA repair photolyase
MVQRRGRGDWTQVYRPCRLSEVVGNDKAKKILENAFKKNSVPHNILFHGLSGSGKTTLARIVEMGLNCKEGPTSEPCCECDYCKRIINRHTSTAVLEINAVDVVKKDLREMLGNFSSGGYGSFEGLDKSIFLVDEAHGLSDDQAGLFLKYTEDVPEWNYFIFCTTEPKKLLKTLRNRCTLKIPFEKVSDDDIKKLLLEICEKENLQPNLKVLKNIISNSEGMPREAVNLLQNAMLTEELESKGSTKSETNKGAYKIIDGDPRVVLIAPHGVKVANKEKFDANTDKITFEVVKRLGCRAFVNKGIKREECDFNLYTDVSEKHPEFLLYLGTVAKPGVPALIVWIHGISDESIKAEAKNKDSHFGGKPDDLHALIGYGQGPNPSKLTTDIENRFTAKTAIVEKFKDILTQNGMATILTREHAKNYRGRDPNNMNQWFLNQGYDLSQVESLQLEIKETGFRGDGDIEKTVEIISNALLAMIEPVKEINEPVVELVAMDTAQANLLPVPIETEADEGLVERAYNELAGIFTEHIQRSMIEAGQYIIREFYGDDYEHARQKKTVRGQSLRRLIERLKEGSGNAPSKTWVYDAVNLAVDERQYSAISAYGNLGHSKKVCLTHVKKPETKELLIQEAGEYTVAELKKRIVEAKKKNIVKIPLENLPSIESLAKYDEKLLRRGEQEAKGLAEFHKKKSAIFEGAYKKINSIVKDIDKIAEKKGGNGDRISGFHEWTKEGNIVNICWGCSNDCIYCFNKAPFYRKGWVKKGHWKDEVIRQNEIDTKRKLFNGRVAFPTSHDITLKNIESYLIVLGKVLRAGNEVLIVTKPRFECIKKVCDASAFFKDETLFRFTIGATNNKILSFWEPNAPSYNERKKSLTYAYEQGFKTSVSVEPMLDSPKIDDLISDLMPLVSDAIWIGKMNHMNNFDKVANKDLKKAVEKIHANQTDEKVLEIYEQYKDNPKVKWKDSIKKVVGIEAPPAPGMDI